MPASELWDVLDTYFEFKSRVHLYMSAKMLTALYLKGKFQPHYPVPMVIEGETYDRAGDAE